MLFIGMNLNLYLGRACHQFQEEGQTQECHWDRSIHSHNEEGSINKMSMGFDLLKEKELPGGMPDVLGQVFFYLLLIACASISSLNDFFTSPVHDFLAVSLLGPSHLQLDSVSARYTYFWLDFWRIFLQIFLLFHNSFIALTFCLHYCPFRNLNLKSRHLYLAARFKRNLKR